jgi:hypothetical protein
MSFLQRLENADRRWVFLLMGLAVAVPIIYIGLTGKTLPERATPLAESAFQVLDDLPTGSRILLAWDFDPASEGELGPMATSFIRQCSQRGHRMYFIALWPVGAQMIRSTTSKVIGGYYPDLVYGQDWVDLGFKAGNEAVIKTIATDFRQMFPSDARGTSVSAIPMMEGITSIADFDAIVNVSAGYPGSKEWVLYAATPLKKPLVVGCTGVQAPLMYPYVPNQVRGLLGAIKGAAEYESVVNDWVREDRMRQALIAGGMSETDAATTAAELASKPKSAGAWTETAAAASLTPESKAAVIAIAAEPTPGIFLEAQRRMGPQLVAHLLMIGLIVMGNVVYFASRRRGGGR